MTDRNFTDADLKALIDLFWAKVQEEVGKGILKGIWSAIVGFCIGAAALPILPHISSNFVGKSNIEHLVVKVATKLLTPPFPPIKVATLRIIAEDFA